MKGWRTIAYGALIAGISVLSSPEVAAFVADHLPAVGGLLGTGVIILRALTNSSIFKGG